MNRQLRNAVVPNGYLFSKWANHWSAYQCILSPNRDNTTSEERNNGNTGYHISRATLEEFIGDVRCGIYELMITKPRTRASDPDPKRTVVYIGNTCREGRNLTDRIMEYCRSGSHKADNINKVLRDGHEVYVRFKPSRDSSGESTVVQARQDEDQVLYRFKYPWNIQYPPHTWWGGSNEQCKCS